MDKKNNVQVQVQTWKWTWKCNPRRIRKKLGSKTAGMIGAHRKQAVKIFLNKDVTSGDVRIVHKKKRPPKVCLLKERVRGKEVSWWTTTFITSVVILVDYLIDNSSNDQSSWFSRISLSALLRLLQSQGEGLRFQSWFWIACIFIYQRI